MTQAANNGYYMPLIQQIQKLEKASNLNAQKKHAIVDLLTLAANNHFVPAMETLYFYYKDALTQIDIDDLRKRSAIIGSRYAFVSYFEQYIQEAESGNKDAQIKLYQTALIEKLYTSKIMKVYEYAEGNDFPALTASEKQQIRIKADTFISNMTPVIYIDELHPQFGF